MTTLNFFEKMRLRFSALYRQYGWKAVAGVFCYYLIRDLTLYVFVPYILLGSK